MSWNPITLNGLSFLGKNKTPAVVEFKSGLNVICGATDSGKSFILESIDFMLASTHPTKLKDVPERVGYETVRLSVKTRDEDLTLERPTTMGSNFSLFKGDFLTEQLGAPESILMPNYNPYRKSVSELLLSKIDLSDKYVLTNKEGETKQLGFRQLVPFVLIDEQRIIKSETNVLGDQFVHYTRDYSTFKLLLTGIDDRALRAVEPEEAVEESDSSYASNAAKISFIEEMIGDIDNDLSSHDRTKNELEERLGELSGVIANQNNVLADNQKQLNIYYERRRQFLSENLSLQGRLDELESLFSRFDLLRQHYQVDLERLSAIEETGSLFIHLSQTRCPLCGASVDDQHLEEQCDGNVEEIIIASQSESQKVTRLLTELEQTISDLQEEYTEIAIRFESYNNAIIDIDAKIKELASPMEKLQLSFNELLEESVEIRSLLAKINQRQELIKKKEQLSQLEIKETSPAITAEKPTAANNISEELSSSVLDKYAQIIEDILKTWHFPDCDRVHFDTQNKDIVINGKIRGNRGKGLRAVAQAAMTIGLMEYCRNNDLSHPGFVVIDSPLLGYYEPDGDEEILKGTHLKERFYEHLSSNYNDCQIIIIENEDPPKDLGNVIHFTKNPYSGRYGFFPI